MQVMWHDLSSRNLQRFKVDLNIVGMPAIGSDIEENRSFGQTEAPQQISLIFQVKNNWNVGLHIQDHGPSMGTILRRLLFITRATINYTIT